MQKVLVSEIFGAMQYKKFYLYDSIYIKVKNQSNLCVFEGCKQVMFTNKKLNLENTISFKNNETQITYY